MDRVRQRRGARHGGFLMQIRTRIKTDKPTNDFEKSLEQELLSFTQELAQILNGGIKFSDNFNAAILDISDSGIADAANTLTHGLKRTPIGFLVLNINKAGAVYSSSFSDTTAVIKCNVANATIKVMVF